ncbi:enoyl-CoA hydratase/isomerase family protein [Oceanobacillus piezotolerans]|uniref:enoyl-CoA hydratase/isomerase family protein n=1 Tax=Oceanobacillus piezotolerans TaxID=2448030 RepID=UPI001314542E|nr:enoyl-CoA hydratase [Oceanobacillus piezotolerans]
MTNHAVLLDITDNIATITFNQPDRLNVLSSEIISGLTDSLRQIKEDSSIRVVILTGEGKAFNAGGDIKSFPDIKNAGVGRNYMTQSIRFYKDLASLEKPTIAAVNGYAVGAGFSLAITCDLVIASENATFNMGFNRMGLVPDLGGLYYLPRLVGMQRAKMLAFSGKNITAEEAKQYGICLEVTKKEELMNRARELALSLRDGTGYSVGLTKSIINQSFESSLEDILFMESMAQAISFTTEDHHESVKAFFEKREPKFTGI